MPNPTTERQKAYKLALAIREEKKWGSQRIRQKLLELGYNISHGSLDYWVYLNRKPSGRPWKTPIPESARKLTTEKAFILSVIGPRDGSLSQTPPSLCPNAIKLSVTDKDFADEFKRCLEFVYRITPSKYKELPRRRSPLLNGRKVQGKKVMYITQLYSVEVGKDLLSYGVSFREGTWRIPQAIKEAPLKIKGAYLQGFFDSQGSVTGRPKDVARYIRGYSKNEGGLEEIVELLKSLGIASKLKRGWRGGIPYVLIAGRINLKRFAELVNFSIKRKKEKIEHGLTTYKITPTPEVDVLIPRAIQMRRTGLFYRQIGQELGIDGTTVSKRLSKTEEFGEAV